MIAPPPVNAFTPPDAGKLRMTPGFAAGAPGLVG